jgi:hypothetical protein
MSENRQIVENPLLLTNLFRQGVYYFGEGSETAMESPQLVVSQEEGASVVAAISPSIGGDIAAEETKLNDNKLDVNEESAEEMINLTVINLFFDTADSQWDDAIQTSYSKLMSVVKVNQEAVIAEDIESIIVANEESYNPSMLGDRISPVIFVWSDRAIQGVPELYKARPTEKGVMLRFPAFASMCADVEMKKMVWQTMKQVLKF